MPFFEGFLIGFAMIIFVGPVLFTILQITLQKGKITGFSAATGVFISDVICVLICFYAAKELLNEIQNSTYIHILGALILFLIGFTYIFKPNLNTKSEDGISKLSVINAFSKGFLVNFVNPFVFGVWISVIGIAKGKYQSDQDLIIYLIAATFAVLVTDSLKVALAKKISPLLKPKLLSKIYKISGIALILFGFRMLAHLFLI